MQQTTEETVRRDCGKPFKVRASITDGSKGIKPQCPRCGSEKFIRTFTSINVLTARRAEGGGTGACGPTAGP